MEVCLLSFFVVSRLSGSNPKSASTMIMHIMSVRLLSVFFLYWARLLLLVMVTSSYAEWGMSF